MHGGRRGKELAAGVVGAASGLDGVTPLVGQAESHERGLSLDALSALGIKGGQYAVRGLRREEEGIVVLLGPLGGRLARGVGIADDELAVSRVLGRFAEHGHHARKGRRCVPVEHGAGVGAYLVETAAHRLCVEFDVAAGAPFVVDAHLAPLHHVARRVEQFDVEHAAQLRRPERRGAHYIGAEPDGLAFEVAVIVEMHEHLFARPALVVTGHLLKLPHQAVGRGRRRLRPERRAGRKKQQAAC